MTETRTWNLNPKHASGREKGHSATKTVTTKASENEGKQPVGIEPSRWRRDASAMVLAVNLLLFRGDAI